MYEIITDVSTDIDADFAARNGVKYIGMRVVVGEESSMYTRPETPEALHLYYDKLRKKVPTSTSQITSFQYEEAFRAYVQAGTPILYIALSSGLSSTYDSACLAARNIKEEFPDAQIEVVDSLGGTGGPGLLTESACKNRDAGMTLAENAAWLRAHANQVDYWFMVEDLMYLKRGGRISAATAVMGTALNIKPVLTINGKGSLETIAKKRGRNQGLQYMVERFCETYHPDIDPTVYIDCSDCFDSAEALKKMILEKHPEAVVRITPLSPVIGAHTGPDTITLIHYGVARV